METLLDKLRLRGFYLTATGGKLFVEPASKLSDEDRAAIRENKPELLQALKTPSREPELILLTIQSRAAMLTDDARLIAAVGNLLNDCRDFWRDGFPQRALALARHLEKSIPEYFQNQQRSRNESR